MNYAIGIDIGGTRTKAGLVETGSGEVIHSTVFHTEKQDERAFLIRIKSAVDELSDKCPGDGTFKGIGIAASGFVHNKSGVIDEGSGAFIPFFAGYPLKAKIEELTGYTCKIGNDAQLACYGECIYGAGKDYRNVLMLTLGTGVGVGLIKDKMYPDEPSLVHRAGHIKVRDSNGEESCYCGITGCLETACSGKGMEEIGLRRYSCHMDARQIFQNAIKGDKTASECVGEYVACLTNGLNQYIYLYAPDLIILGGGIAHSLSEYLHVIRKKSGAKVYKDYEVCISICDLYENGGILGAAACFQK